MSYTQTSWKDGDVITADGLNKMEAGITGADTAAQSAKTAAEEAKTTASANADAIAENEVKDAAQDEVILEVQGKNTEQDTALEALNVRLGQAEAATNEQAGQSTILSQKIALLEAQVANLQIKNATTHDLAEGAISSEEDIVVTSTAPITNISTVSAKSVTVKAMEVQSSRAAITATNGDIAINQIAMSGDLPKSVSNAALSANAADGIVRISGGDMNQTGYNSIEVGLKDVSKMVLIENIEFRAVLSNNAISVFGLKEGGTLTISNCHFAKCSNPIRISNKENTTFTINLVNCTVDAWEPNPEYTGFICFQDYTTAGDAAAMASANQFGKDKITVNFINCTGPHGKIVAPEDPAAVYGSKTIGQLLYVYNKVEQVVSYSEDRYPTVTYK